ncbi:zinc finger and BTB domain-containing protein 32 isoform X1 [Peromyscus maniculatus bairdii]|uniref:zinc finger and BTB domain-containing protein 32 isoform X1 n=1 Tax=Peromyscus maniculatus bairdii TaxID=230844 RepID=UPI00077DEE1E|nr:zinc finger and BTB domain-containing protein 32 isoform X1 [Peromyscus maniculatus bairdii]XP_042124427.1 zinc finger and BTB domain-containing protein 32 isoform X1 [Peromyscus maniculatus bairdii]XP_042124436.1 zinc finger and BTB domain-containing protein 32 isoform X1 [Peromyscus maniculatus bairdii]
MPQTPMRLISPYGSDRLVQLAARLRPALCDTLITVGGLEFPAHSLVLAGASPRLGCRGRWALVEGISPSTFAQLLTFVYGESVELQPGELGNLEEAARALGVQALEEACKRAQKDKSEDELEPGLKRHQEAEELRRKSERGLGGPGEKQKPEKDFRSSGREQEMLNKRKAARESPERAGITRKMRSEEALSPAPVGHRGAERKQGEAIRGIESPERSEECLRGCPGPLSPPGSLLTSLIPRPWWAEAPWCREGQPSLWSIFLWPPSSGTPFSLSTSITAAWQVWPQDQRIPLTLSHSKGLWSQNQLASSSPTPGSFPQGPEQLSPWEIEESGPGRTGTLATCVGQDHTLSCPSHQHPPLPPPARSRPYSCSVCGKRFSLKHQMETHYRVHTGEKPFSCSLCPQRSRDFSAMTKHLRTHGAAPYRCPLCRAGCPSLASMQAHMRGHSPSQLPPGWTIRSTFLYSSSRPTRASISPGNPTSSSSAT